MELLKCPPNSSLQLTKVIAYEEKVKQIFGESFSNFLIDIKSLLELIIIF